MKKTFTIKVTQEDIDKGIKSNCDSCMVARALQRCLNDKNVWCGSAVHTTNYQSQSLPMGVVKKIERFDSGLPVKPFEFKLTLYED